MILPPGGLIRGVDDLDPFCRKHAIERGCEFRVIFVNEKSDHIPIVVFQIPDQLARLLCNPGFVGICRASCQLNSSGSQFDEEQPINGLEPNCFHREEIVSQDLILIVSQEAAPGTCRPLGYRSDTMSLEDIAH
jgi:hypothetical protein